MLIDKGIKFERVIRRKKIALGAALGSTIHKESSSSEEKWKN